MMNNIVVTTEPQLCELITKIISTELKRLMESLLPQHQPTDTLPEILNVKQAAEVLDLAPSTVYGLVNKSILPHSKKGGKLRFKRSQLIAWIDSGEKKTRSKIEEGIRIHTRRPSKQ